MKPSPTLALTEELIALSSITPDDKGCQRRLIALLSPLGFVCETIESNGVTNLWARRGTTAPSWGPPYLLRCPSHTSSPPHPTLRLEPAELPLFWNGRGDE